jgi:hypothetical protein
VAIFPIFGFWMYMVDYLRCPNFKISKFQNFKNLKLLLYPNSSKCRQFCSAIKFTWLNSKLNLLLSNLYGRHLPLALWSLIYKIWVQKIIFLTPNHLTTVPSDLFYNEFWSRFDFSLSKIVERYLKDFSFLALMIF